MRKSSSMLVMWLVAGALWVAPQAQAPATIAIRGVTLIDGTGRAPVPTPPWSSKDRESRTRARMPRRRPGRASSMAPASS